MKEVVLKTKWNHQAPLFDAEDEFTRQDAKLRESTRAWGGCRARRASREGISDVFGVVVGKGNE
jgi:hypothetical protein